MKKKQRHPVKKFDNSLDVPSSVWLKKHGLVARKLTICHILNPVVVKMSKHFIPVLTKDAVVQVLLNSPSTAKYPFQVLNLAQVDLKVYEEKLLSSLVEYKQRLDMIVWRNISQEKRDKFGDGPVCYLTNQNSLNQALDQAGWKVSPKQLQLMIDEIYQGQMYLKQCREIEKTYRNSLIDLNQVLNPREVLKEVKIGVIARDEANGFYYDGEVEGRHGNSKYLISLDNGKKVKVLQKHCYLHEDVGSQPLKVGEYVLVYRKKPFGFYTPGMIIESPRTQKLRDSLYCILLFTKEKVSEIREKLGPVDDATYDETVEYIKSMQPEYELKEDSTSSISVANDGKDQLMELLISDAMKSSRKNKLFKPKKCKKDGVISKHDFKEIHQKLEIVQTQMEESFSEMSLQRKAIKLQSQLLFNLMDDLQKHQKRNR